jgi:hypothetical protein
VSWLNNRKPKEENQKALDTVIMAIDVAIGDYKNWAADTSDRQAELKEIKRLLDKNRMVINCGARF